MVVLEGLAEEKQLLLEVCELGNFIGQWSYEAVIERGCWLINCKSMYLAVGALFYAAY